MCSFRIREIHGKKQNRSLQWIELTIFAVFVAVNISVALTLIIALGQLRKLLHETAQSVKIFTNSVLVCVFTLVSILGISGAALEVFMKAKNPASQYATASEWKFELFWALLYATFLTSLAGGLLPNSENEPEILGQEQASQSQQNISVLTIETTTNNDSD